MAVKGIVFAGMGLLAVVAYFGWKLSARGAYESAEYTVLKSDGCFEVRQYPDLMMATTDMEPDGQADDGSFMRLFRYISGANDLEQKVAMTTPVFMASEDQTSRGNMGFVLPASITAGQIPRPADEGVEIRKREGGRFAVIRFAGRVDEQQRAAGERQLREWMDSHDYVPDGEPELAGYDPPWTPGPLRRNEILFRLN